ncbi:MULTISPECIES: CTP synthase [unclassified Pseudomonas]|jgi:CTP synthase (UTP-ammonia lyase)|uniref:CTP synthase C-terminal region-related (seleno)protein n=1 Tax=unclassified Pseudomonas TaxID=196821 RepID=UPI001032CB62|nr:MULTISPECIES: CTP synthase [unclassified Pseudomonas]
MSTLLTIRVGLIGDRDLSVTAHRAIEQALPLTAAAMGISIEYEWLATDSINPAHLLSFNGLWCVPASPYRDTEAVLAAISYGRKEAIPFLGTCGGFQHALLEYARNALGWRDAEHGELPSQGGRAVIAPLTCALVETQQSIRLAEGSRIAKAYSAPRIQEGYRCRYGLNPQFAAELLEGSLRATGWDEDGEVRAVELMGAAFFVATLFQPERVALEGQTPPLVRSWLQACTDRK